ncbi:hypothetical protein ISCGN_023082 [Ixodes scapularis]
MAVETTSAAMTYSLLRTDKLASLPLHATLAPARAVSIGVIRGLCPNDATEKLTRGLESEVPVDHIRRFIGGRYAELFFGGPLPATVVIYDIEFVVEARHVRVAAKLQKKKASERSTQRAQEPTAAPPPWMHSGASQTPAWQTSVLPASSVWGDTFPTLEARSRPNAVSTTRELTPPVAIQPTQVKTREASTNTEPSAKIPKSWNANGLGSHLTHLRAELLARPYEEPRMVAAGTKDGLDHIRRFIGGRYAELFFGGPLPATVVIYDIEFVVEARHVRVAAKLQKKKASERSTQRAQEPTAAPPPWMHSGASQTPAWQTSVLPASSVWGDTFPTLEARSRPNAWNANGLGSHLTHLRAELLARPYEEPRMVAAGTKDGRKQNNDSQLHRLLLPRPGKTTLGGRASPQRRDPLPDRKR